jgi:exoribonuclease R
METIYKFQSLSRDYDETNVTPDISVNVDPITNKLFSGDDFSYSNSNQELSIIKSPIRENQSIPGVLILHGNQTFGRSTNNRVLYKCIPHDKTLPIFLVPYDIKIGFQKSQVNKYILFCFSNWDGKHPCGIITETIGRVDCFQSFCTYQLWTRDLVHSMTKFNRELNRKIKDISYSDIIYSICSDPQYNVEDHTDDYVFTIDPDGSVDLDDGFSIRQTEDTMVITVHIANVYACIDKLGLWEYMTPRVSTIYLPDDRKTMLPNALSDRICSLLAKTERITFAMEVIVDNSTGQIRNDSVRFFNAMVRIGQNFRYEEKALRKNLNYKKLYEITRKLDTSIIDSHDVVAYWMVYMNSMAAKTLYESKTGVFRSVIAGEANEIPSTTGDVETRRVLESWKNTHSTYQLFDETSDVRHMTLNVDSYVHITSPIRRIVDILNQICFHQSILDTNVSTDALAFLNKSVEQMDKLNIDVKSIQRVQMDCDMLHSCIHNPDITNEQHSGVVFNRILISDAKYRYTVYLNTVKRMYMLDSTHLFDNYSTHMFKILLFDAENTGHRKMRITTVGVYSDHFCRIDL